MNEIKVIGFIDMEILKPALKEAEKARSRLKTTMLKCIKERNKELLKPKELQDKNFLISISRDIMQISDYLYPEFNKRGK